MSGFTEENLDLATKKGKFALVQSDTFDRKSGDVLLRNDLRCFEREFS
ncbi:MAG: hypothetical protein H0V82_12330 [Candidatus Protochlamydia sp.]|nr:hypothetical protein [Candidatus Protochlamydia sp.]